MLWNYADTPLCYEQRHNFAHALVLLGFDHVARSFGRGFRLLQPAGSLFHRGGYRGTQ